MLLLNLGKSKHFSFENFKVEHRHNMVNVILILILFQIMLKLTLIPVLWLVICFEKDQFMANMFSYFGVSEHSCMLYCNKEIRCYILSNKETKFYVFFLIVENSLSMCHRKI